MPSALGLVRVIDQEMTYYKPFSFLMGISMGKWPDFEYHVGKWLKYDRSGYNSSHPSLGSPWDLGNPWRPLATLGDHAWKWSFWPFWPFSGMVAKGRQWSPRVSRVPGWSIFNINQTNPKAIFLVRLRYPNRKLTRKLFHNRQTKLSGYSTTDRIKPSGYSSLLFRWLFHNAFILKVAQRMGMKIQSYTLSHNNHKQVPSRQVPLHKREDDERVWLRWNN